MCRAFSVPPAEQARTMKGNRSTLASAMLLITGILVGGSAAAAIVVAVAGLVRGDAPTEAR
jgi:hypothetical protein